MDWSSWNYYGISFKVRPTKAKNNEATVNHHVPTFIWSCVYSRINGHQASWLSFQDLSFLWSAFFPVILGAFIVALTPILHQALLILSCINYLVKRKVKATEKKKSKPKKPPAPIIIISAV